MISNWQMILRKIHKLEPEFNQTILALLNSNDYANHIIANKMFNTKMKMRFNMYEFTSFFKQD